MATGEWDFGKGLGRRFLSSEFEGSEVFDTVEEDYSLTGASIKVTLRVPWKQRFAIACELLTGDTESDRFPARHPSANDMFVSSVSIRPVPTKYGQDGDAIDYQYGLLTIQYSPIATEVSLESSSQFVTVNAVNCYWSLTENGETKEEPIAPDEFPGILMPSHTISLSRPYVNLKNRHYGTTLDLFELEGTCNKNAITFSYCGLTKTYPAETLALQSPSMRGGYRLLDGLKNEPCFAISCQLAYNPLTHNKWFHPRQDGDDEDPIGSRAVEMMVQRETPSLITVLKPVDYTKLFELFDILG